MNYAKIIFGAVGLGCVILGYVRYGQPCSKGTLIIGAIFIVVAIWLGRAK